MKISIATIIFFISFSQKSSAQPQKVRELADGGRLIESFESEKIGTLPQRWYNQRANTAVPDLHNRDTYLYKVMEEDGNKFLRFQGVHGKHLNFPTKEVKNINLQNTPILCWKWRIMDIPEGENEANENDVAASIYVVFDLGHILFKKVPKSIRYTWSSKLDKGTELSKLFGNQQIIVMGTGKENRGKWQTFRRNIVADYKRLFNEDPPSKPLAILILSDGNDTGNVVKADYDDILLETVKN